MIAVALGLFSVALLTRHLGEAGFGQYSTVLAFLGIIAVLADLGLYLIVVREISKEGADRKKIISNSIGLRLTTAFIILVIGAFIALLFPYDQAVKQAMFVGIGAFLFVSLNQVLVGIFQKHLVQYLVVLSEMFGRALNLLLIWLFIQNQVSLPYFVLALVLGNALNFFITYTFARRYEEFSIAFDFSYWKTILISSWPLAFAVILNLIYFKTDTIILSVFHPQEAVGVYSLPFKILEVLLAFPAMFVGLIMPLMSRYALNDLAKFKNILQRSFDALWLLAVPMVITTLFFAQDIIGLIKGPGQTYADSPRLLQILIFAAAMIFFGTLFGYAVVAVNKQKQMIRGYLTAAITGLLLYFILIPRFSYWGAAAGTLVTELIVVLFAYFFVYKASKYVVNIKILLKSLPAVTVLVLTFHYLSLNWILEIFIGLIAYSLLLIAFRAVPTTFVKELVFLRQK